MELAENWLDWLKSNPYPGRGIVIGHSPEGKRVIVYWLMGRSENSKNRILVRNDDGSVSTKAFDESKVTDPSLIIYTAYRSLRNGDIEIISNGDQTDTIANAPLMGTLNSALAKRTFEPDAPNYTPRISAMFNADNSHSISVLTHDLSRSPNPKRIAITADHEYNPEEFGLGYMVTTYVDNGNPLPAFCHMPLPVHLKSTAEENLEQFWDCLNPEYRISMMAKHGDAVLIRNIHA